MQHLLWHARANVFPLLEVPAQRNMRTGTRTRIVRLDGKHACVMIANDRRITKH